MQIRIEIDGHVHDVHIDDGKAAVNGDEFAVDEATMSVDGRRHKVGLATAAAVEMDGETIAYKIHSLQGVAGLGGSQEGGHGPVHAPMTGKVESIEVEAGQVVAVGDVLFVLEAMKMRNQVKASVAGTVSAIHAAPGDAVDPRTAIVELSP